MRLRDKMAVITGGAGGIGQAIALRLAQEGTSYEKGGLTRLIMVPRPPQARRILWVPKPQVEEAF